MPNPRQGEAVYAPARKDGKKQPNGYIAFISYKHWEVQE
jgi:hypothetical protein